MGASAGYGVGPGVVVARGMDYLHQRRIIHFDLRVWKKCGIVGLVMAITNIALFLQSTVISSLV